MKRQDSFGILGTPLRSDAGSQSKMSAQNKIAPTPIVYSKLRQNAVLRKERALLDKTALLATRNDDLYMQRTRPSHLEDVMDDEDRAYLRVKGIVNRRKPDSNRQLSTAEGAETSFLATSVDLPEIVPRQARTPHGYRELSTFYSLRREESPQVQQKTRCHSDYQSCQTFPHAMCQDLKSGLGYISKETVYRSTGDVGSKGDPHILEIRKGLESSSRGTDIDEDSDAEDYMERLANSGYKNLDATEKLMSQKLKEGLSTSTQTKGAKRRMLSGTGIADYKNIIFASFVEQESLDKHDMEWTEYIIPAHFAANPSHSGKEDQMKTNLDVLPPSLQQEYKTLLHRHSETLSKEADNVKTSIAKATKEQDAKLRRIRGLVLEDMGARFIGPQESTGEKNPSRLGSYGTKESRQEEGCDSKHPRQGQTNRTTQFWKPENLLRKRLGVEVPKCSEMSSGKEMKVPGKNFVLSSRQAGEFQIQSITNTDGTRTDISSDCSLLQDGLIVLGSSYDMHGGAKGDKRPSRDLLQIIFANARPNEDGQLNCEQNPSNEASNPIASRMKNEARGIHKTRAVDFF